MHQKTCLFLILTALILASPAPGPRIWKIGAAGLEVSHWPSDAIASTATVQADYDGDGQPEKLTLSSGGSASITSSGKLRWQSPPAWQVRQAQIADLDQDNQPEAVLLVWRQFKPWPVDAWLPSNGRINSFHNQLGFSCHLILIGWSQNEFREEWAGSALAEPILAFAAIDKSGAGKQALITLDGNYDVTSTAPATQLKVWEWNGFGFTVVSRVEGRFSRLLISRSKNGQAFLITP